MIFLINSTTVGKESGCAGLNTYLCDNLDSNTETCACYTGNANGYWSSLDCNTSVCKGQQASVCCNKDCTELNSKWKDTNSQLGPTSPKLCG
ncbi:MAG: hypothetical protein WC874_00195 [Candidatus Izemoplasmatales bacterium]